MAYTYGNDPANSVIDRLRLVLGDIDVTTPNRALLTDEVIAFHLAGQDNDEDKAAWALCEVIVSLLVREVDFTTGATSASRSQMLKQYQSLLKRLERDKSGRHVAFDVGGLSESEKLAYQADSDLTQPSFTRDMHRNPQRPSDT